MAMILVVSVVITVGGNRDDACQEIRTDVWWRMCRQTFTV